MKEITMHTTWKEETVVTENLLAKTVGSGDVAVYATPMMVALMEKAAAACLKPFLEEGETSVGILMNTTHAAATPCGMKVWAEAEIVEAEGRKVTFRVVARDEKEVIGEAHHQRFILAKEKFEQKAQNKLL
ncbi:MAG: thioesterase family protein [Massiliimalia sp.]|jgi:fluoroacetyl-CoA thioesterase